MTTGLLVPAMSIGALIGIALSLYLLWPADSEPEAMTAKPAPAETTPVPAPVARHEAPPRVTPAPAQEPAVGTEPPVPADVVVPANPDTVAERLNQLREEAEQRFAERLSARMREQTPDRVAEQDSPVTVMAVPASPDEAADATVEPSVAPEMESAPMAASSENTASGTMTRPEVEATPVPGVENPAGETAAEEPYPTTEQPETVGGEPTPFDKGGENMPAETEAAPAAGPPPPADSAPEVLPEAVNGKSGDLRPAADVKAPVRNGTTP